MSEAPARLDGIEVFPLFDQMVESVACYERDGTIRYANPTTCRMFGRPLEALLGQNLWELFPGARGNPFHEAFERVARTGVAEHFEHFYADDERWYDNHVYLADGRVWVVGNDVTDQKLAASRLLQIGDALPALVSLIDKDGRYQFVNGTYATWFGRPASEIIGRRLPEVLGEAAYAAIEPYVRRVLAGETVTYEARIPYATGGERDVQATYTPFRSDGAVMGYVALVMDVTERVRLAREREGLLVREHVARRAAEQTEARLRYLVESNPYAVAMFDRDMRYIFASRRWLSDFRLELTNEEIRGRSHYDVFPETPEHWKEIHRRGLAGEVLRSEGEAFGRKDGTVDWMRWEIRPWTDDRGEVGGLLIFSEDLRERELWFRSVADNIAQLAWMADEHGERIWFNRRWFEYTGTTADEVRGWGWQKVHPPEDAAQIVDAYRRHIATGQPWTDTFPLRGKDGNYRWFLTQAVPVRDPSGRVVRWFGTKTDITTEREAEVTLRRALQLRDEFMSVASHELRTPLTALVLQLEGLQQLIGRIAGGDGERAAKKLDIAIRQTDRLAALIEGLLDVSRIASGRLQLQLERFDLAELVRATTARLADLAVRARVDVRLTLGGPVEGTWDRARLEQVLLNLLGNAIKYGVGAPVDVTLGVAGETGELVELAVRDRGIGISAEDQERIFGRFERAVPAKHYGGLGLGLYIARQIVEAHGGEIRVESAPGSGATFLIRLPRVTRPRVAAAAAEPIQTEAWTA